MSLIDTRAFLQELFTRLDPETDVTQGSRVDSEFIQPLLRRIGTDPFSIDLRAFIYDRMAQEFPDVTTSEGDAVVDLLLKPLELLLDPVIREHQRVRRQLSFRDPASLTMEEAEALGANFFVPLLEVKYARGTVRLYFEAPRSETVTPANVITSRLGQGFFPDGTQSITAEQMLLRTEGSLYYFDVQVVAAEPGEQYNVDAGELVKILGINTVVRVTNKQRFRTGTPAEDVDSYVARVRRSITERSLVSFRGILAQLPSSVPEITRLNVVGRGDEGMTRDVLQGGSLGTVLAAGFLGSTIHDGRALSKTSRVQLLDAGIDLFSLIGPAGAPDKAAVLTLMGDFLGSPPVADLTVTSVVSATQLDVDGSLPYGKTGLSWTLRLRELLVQSMPGGLPSVDGEPVAVSAPPGEVHIGGAYDVLLRAGALLSDSIVIASLTDERPVSSGIDADSDGLGEVVLNDLILSPSVGYTYDDLSDLYNTLADTRTRLLLQVLDGPAAGTYPIRSVIQPGDGSGHPVLQMFAPYPASMSARRWRIIDAIDQDLQEPKSTRISGKDLVTLQASAQVRAQSNVDFNEYGVAAGDTLRILLGPLKGDYQVASISADGITLTLDRALTRTLSNVKYTVIKLSSDNGVALPLIRVTSVELLDAKLQSTGVKVPYKHPLAAVSTAFSNPAQGIKLDIPRAIVGVVSNALNPGGSPQANVSGKILALQFATFSVSVTFSGANPVSLTSIVDQINTAAGSHAPVAVVVDDNRLGIIPVDGVARVVGSADPLVSALAPLFGDLYFLDAGMVRNDKFLDDQYVRSAIRPVFDATYDVVELLDGTEQRSDPVKYVTPYSGVTVAESPAGLIPLSSVIGSHAYAPQVGVHAVMGARSLGSARVYFQDPTQLEVDGETVFSADVDGATLLFEPDPSMQVQLVPSPPNGVQPKDGTATGSTFTLLSLSQDFLRTGVLPGDTVEITYVPIQGNVITDPVPLLAGKELRLSTGVGEDLRITFVNDSGGIAATDVTRAGAIDQINRKLGRTIFSLNSLGRLELEDTEYRIIRYTGNANAILGFSALTDTDNVSPHAGTYEVASATATVLTLTEALPGVAVVDRQQYTITRQGIQRITATQMSTQEGPVGLYYADIELVSKGTGDRYNLSTDTRMELSGYRSEGYELLTEDTALSFSTQERLRIRFSPQFHEVGSNADPQAATTLYGQNVQITYDYEPAVRASQDYLESEDARVVCANPLARFLTPHFVRVAIQYAGGPRVTDATKQLETIIHATFPDTALEVSDLVHEITRRGATSVTNPVMLYALVHNQDRTIRLDMSADRINLGKVAAFFPDRIDLTRSAG